jgi:hypothetical protein
MKVSLHNIKQTIMDYILEDYKTGIKMYITKDQKDLLDSIADIEYSPVDTKMYIVNRNKYYLSLVRNGK